MTSLDKTRRILDREERMQALWGELYDLGFEEESDEFPYMQDIRSGLNRLLRASRISLEAQEQYALARWQGNKRPI